jgi:hypothetical protein
MRYEKISVKIRVTGQIFSTSGKLNSRSLQKSVSSKLFHPLLCAACLFRTHWMHYSKERKRTARAPAKCPLSMLHPLPARPARSAKCFPDVEKVWIFLRNRGALLAQLQQKRASVRILLSEPKHRLPGRCIPFRFFAPSNRFSLEFWTSRVSHSTRKSEVIMLYKLSILMLYLHHR